VDLIIDLQSNQGIPGKSSDDIRVLRETHPIH